MQLCGNRERDGRSCVCVCDMVSRNGEREKIMLFFLGFQRLCICMCMQRAC